MAKRLVALLVLAAVLGSAAWYATRPRAAATAPLRLEATDDSAGFALALEPRDFTFPRDHGPHFDFQTEWWYYTGNLETASGQHVGYQLTFFRRGLAPTASARESSFATSQIYFAHFAITDVAGDAHSSAERFSRGAAGLAGASGEPYAVWLEDWRADALNADGSAVHLVARQDDLAIDLTLEASKAIVAHGDRGLSPKGGPKGNASYYLSFTRMTTRGSVRLGHGEPVPASGESWFDHEWSTSALGPGIVGWDWFSLQLGDGRELMYFQLRREDGSVEPVSSGTLVEADGRARRLGAEDVQLEVLGTWTSPRSRARYPSGWRLAVPSAGIAVEIQPWIKDQEMRVSFVYWEGAVQVRGSSAGAGYVELTGYAGSLAGQF